MIIKSYKISATKTVCPFYYLVLLQDLLTNKLVRNSQVIVGDFVIYMIYPP